MSSLASALRVLATAVELLEQQLQERSAEAELAGHQITTLECDLADLESELAEAELVRDEDVCELIADVRRGVRTLDELYERTLSTLST